MNHTRGANEVGVGFELAINISVVICWYGLQLPCYRFHECADSM